MIARSAAALAIVLAWSLPVVAQDAEPVEAPPSEDVESDGEPTFHATGALDDRTEGTEGRSTTRVDREQMRERLARSAPDALRYVPGVSIQQTTHGQASPFVRGLTGQQVLVLFDGVRLNNGLYRQGPNQYFFTVDLQSIDHIDVVRGSASTLWGSDALGGAILAAPLEPLLDARQDGLTLHPRGFGRFGSQDLDLGGRFELDAQLGRDVGILVGGGYRAADRLQAAGPITNPGDGSPTVVPFFEADGRTQRGTGFRYASFDARLVGRINPTLRVIGAVYGFRQFDTPRADQCPPPFAPERECLTFLEQFRTLAYVAIRGDAGPDWRDIDVTLSYQRQHELRSLDRPASFAINHFRDDVDTYGFAARASTRTFDTIPDVQVGFRLGGDAYVDHVASSSTLTFTDLGIVQPLSRGQYSDGAVFAQLGLFLETELTIVRVLHVRGAVRGALAGARASAEPESGTRAVRQDFSAIVGRVGAELDVAPELELLLNVDQGFRAPNLDDLTSRQQAGPGFQFESPDLRPETSYTYELGARVRTPEVQLEAWAYATQLDNAITRALREASDCPPGTPLCEASRSRFSLVNVGSPSWILGGEVALRVDSDIGLGGTATFSAAWGEGPNPSERPSDPTLPYVERVPLSRVPPLNGTVEIRYAHPETHLVFGAALRWALAQDRLAISDLSDARIPIGGTPGYAVVDIRAGWRFERYLQLQLAFENVLDQAYRVHGSGVNGAGRGVAVSLEAAY